MPRPASRLWTLAFAAPLFLALAGPVRAACVADTPLASARWIFEKGYFFFVRPMENAGPVLSDALHQGLEFEWRCKASEASVCAVSVDPWTNAAGSTVADPIVFSLRNSPPDRTRVAMRFVNGSSGEAATAELQMVRHANSGCWVLDDLIGAAGISLRKTLAREAP